MPAFGLNLELDIDTTAGSGAGAVAFDWFDRMSRIAFGDARRALDGEGPTPAAPPYMETDDWNPDRGPVQIRSSIDVLRKAVEAVYREVLGVASRATRRGSGAGRCFRLAYFRIRARFAQRVVSVPVRHRPAESPGWLRLGAYVTEPAFVNGDHAAETQRQWLSGLRTFAEKLNPGFGQIEYGYDSFGTTGLEFSFPPSNELEERRPYYTVGKCRQYLRGYSWLTIVPAELADRLGGQEAMRRTGAFTEAAELQNGGLWLLATEDYRDYGPAQVQRVFRALAPVLRPGTPVSKSYIIEAPPQRVVLQNAADAYPGND